ncbi:MAG: endonuclease III domain-containing protein [Candidatus Altiarchaeota archaeon]|nr:endonuclease III domain-containing protein [Candidatus Altiarchaeota archaeon]
MNHTKKATKAVNKAYIILKKAYGPQGWWPIGGEYHPKIYSLDERDRYEVCLGAILTQNTAWTNVVTALSNLERISIGYIDRLSDSELRKRIRPAGYFNQKTRKIRAYNTYHRKLGGNAPTREGLLSVWGIGPETADSILLYAFQKPTFVVDAYTRRLFNRMGLIDCGFNYDDIKKLVEDLLPRDHRTYNEFHALIVEHSKRFCTKNPRCCGCPLNGMCERI